MRLNKVYSHTWTHTHTHTHTEHKHTHSTHTKKMPTGFKINTGAMLLYFPAGLRSFNATSQAGVKHKRGKGSYPNKNLKNTGRTHSTPVCN